MDHIKLLDQLGSGDFGSVHKAYDQMLCKNVAVKIILDDDEEDGRSSAFGEVSCSNALPAHLNILPVTYSFQTVVKSGVVNVLVFDLMKWDLWSYMRSVCSVPPQTVRHLMRQILQGVTHCHRNNIMHRDLKPKNLLLDDNMNLKLTDFGLGCPMIGSQTLDNELGPLPYSAPELLLGSTRYSSPIDVWAVGCIFAELVTRRTLFCGAHPLEHLLDIFCQQGIPTEKTWPGISSLPVYNSNTFSNFPPEFDSDLHRIGAAGLDLLDRMLAVSPTERITAADALYHPYFTGMPNNKRKRGVAQLCSPDDEAHLQKRSKGC